MRDQQETATVAIGGGIKKWKQSFTLVFKGYQVFFPILMNF